jgi:hypothetical protein
MSRFTRKKQQKADQSRTVPPETGTDDSSRKRLRERGLWVGETGSSFQWTQFPEGARHAYIYIYIYIYIDCHQNPKKQSWMTNGCPNSGSDDANVFSFTLVVNLFPLPWCDFAIRRNCNMQMRDDKSIRLIHQWFLRVSHTAKSSLCTP